MGGKLLKVCAAVMLIAGAGSVGADPCMKGSNEVSMDVSARVIAQVAIMCDGEKKTLKLFDEKGEEAAKEDRTFKFTVKNVAASSKIVVKPGRNTSYDKRNGKWIIYNNKASGEDQKKLEENRVSFRLHLTGTDGKERDKFDGESYKFVEGDDNGIWVMEARPYSLTDKTEAGKYEGSLIVQVSAA